jgi:transcriptional regulator with GAF, ATPase, and Fis domain
MSAGLGTNPRLKSHEGAPEIIVANAQMRRLLEFAERAAASQAKVLITGESGTGKDLVAKVIHYASRRAGRPFLSITCSAQPEALLESEMFGHERGIFADAPQQKRGSLEQADEGTLFLDEIGEIPLSVQVKLLRVLQEGEVERLGGKSQKIDIRLVAATNKDLERAIEASTGE